MHTMCNSEISLNLMDEKMPAIYPAQWHLIFAVLLKLTSSEIALLKAQIFGDIQIEAYSRNYIEHLRLIENKFSIGPYNLLQVSSMLYMAKPVECWSRGYKEGGRQKATTRTITIRTQGHQQKFPGPFGVDCFAY